VDKDETARRDFILWSCIWDPRDQGSRGNITFGVGEVSFVAEAKQGWPILGRKSDNGIRTVGKTMQKALSEASRLPSEGKRMGIVFVTPRVHKSNIRYMDDILDCFTENLSKVKSAALAWYFPPGKRFLNGKDGYRYPGIVLLIKALSGQRLNAVMQSDHGKDRSRN